MRMLRWIVLTPPRGRLSADGKHVEYDMRVRYWHPGFWWAVVRRWWTNR